MNKRSLIYIVHRELYTRGSTRSADRSWHSITKQPRLSIFRAYHEVVSASNSCSRAACTVSVRRDDVVEDTQVTARGTDLRGVGDFEVPPDLWESTRATRFRLLGGISREASCW